MTNTRVLVAMDAFKGSLNAEQACTAVADGLRHSLAQAQVSTAPMADGGEGSLDILLKHLPGGDAIECEVMGPLPELTVKTAFGWWPEERLAVVEAAKACGLPLVHPAQTNPMAATTYGVGQLIRAAADKGVDRIILAVGGSASMDAGMGAARALGWHATDRFGVPVDHGSAGLEHLASLTAPETALSASLEVWCDVRSPLLGTRGAAAMFGPQKGASLEQIHQTNQYFAKLVAHPLLSKHLAIQTLPGSGAAGGLAWGMAVFAGARLMPGAERFAETTGLEPRIAACDLVITGEGCFDKTSLEGKCISHIARLTRKT